jgi:hypothetical protein
VAGAASDLRSARAELLSRLLARRHEIEQAALARIAAISDPTSASDPAYLEGLRAAVCAALDYGFAGIERGEVGSPPVPPSLLAQARLAARNSISLETVLRRYFAGYTLLSDFLIEEAEDGDLLRGTALKRLLRDQATLFDRLLATVSEEYAREVNARPDTSEQRRVGRIERLLAGELLDTSDLAYGIDAFHTGAIATGAGAAETLRELAQMLDRRLLLVRPDEQTAWAWLGSRRRADPLDLERLASSREPRNVKLALGEPGEGLAGWRLTHRQAAAALPIALRGGDRLVRYADVALLASALQDDLLATSLRQLYLAPLEAERDGGEVARETLRAYFDADRNISSAAAALGVNRHTVASRLRAIEQRLKTTLDSRAPDIEAALRLEDLGRPSAIQLSQIPRLRPA